MQLTERYRPSDYSQFVGQDKSIARAKAILKLPSFDRGAFLLTGPSGCGKTSLGNVMADSLGCTDIMTRMEIKGQDCSVQELRDLCEWFRYLAPNGGFKVAIVNECHLMSAAAKSYALELMECPPAKRVIIMTTTEANWCDETLFSRFYRIQFVKPHSDAIVEHLQRVAMREGWNITGLNLKRFVQDRHNNIRLCLMDLEIEAAVMVSETDQVIVDETEETEAVAA